MSSYSYTNTQTFTVTNAKYLASKVAADLKRMQRFYGFPADEQIANYESEIILYLQHGYLTEVLYGFKRNGNWIEPTLKYTAKELSAIGSSDDDPGRISPNADVLGATFYSYLVQNSAYNELNHNQKEEFDARLPFIRGGAPSPGVSGHLSPDKSYFSGGKSLNRSSIKSY